MRVLVLNATYEPINTTGWKRAAWLVESGKASVVEEGEHKVMTPSGAFPVPSVIRMNYMVKRPHRHRVPLNRKAVLARDKSECQFTHCDRRATTIDHVHPRAKGGKHEWTNVAAACQPCNFKKADKTLREMGWKLKREPRTPTGRFMVIGEKTLPEWEKWLEPFE